MRNIQEIKADLEQAVGSHRAAVEVASAASDNERRKSDDVKRLRAEISASITEGARACTECNKLPHGMEQPSSSGLPQYEVGCLTCHGRRVRGATPSHAVEIWNRVAAVPAA